MKKKFKVGDYVKLGKTIARVIYDMPSHKSAIIIKEIHSNVSYIIGINDVEKISEEDARLYAL